MQLGDKFKSRTPFTFVVVSRTGEKFKEHRDLEGRVIGKNTDKDPKKSFAMVKPPHAEEINYCIVSFSDYEKFNKFTNSTENKMKPTTKLKLESLIRRLIKEESSEFGVRWSEFDKNDRIVKKEKVFTTKSALDKFKAALEKKDNFNKFEAHL